MSLRITGLFSYPIKSCAAVAHASAELDSLGLPWDRRWMLVDPDGAFVTQRTEPSLARVQPQLTTKALRVFAPGKQRPIEIALAAPREGTLNVRVWRDSVTAWDEGPEAAEWFSRYAGRPLRLVRFPNDARREVDPHYASRPSQTAFSDGFPLLLATEESLADLNSRLASRGARPVPMNRFRPNVVLAGAAQPYAEDDWLTVGCGERRLDLIKPCTRCGITTTDQQTGTVPEAGEPLATLREYRRWQGQVAFAQNVISHGSGLLSVGAPVSVLEAGTPNRWGIERAAR